jgi:hypothetical protein
MASFHDPQEWLANLKALVDEVNETNDIEKVKKSLEEVVTYFNRPTHTWDLFHSDDTPIHSQATSFTEQVVLEETRHFVWAQLYSRLKNLQYDKGQVFQIEHEPLSFPEFDGCEKVIDDYPPRTLIYEACTINVNPDGNPTEPLKFLRIYSINLPHTESLIYGDGEDFSQYFHYIQENIHSVQQIQQEEDLFDIISKEWERNERKAYPTVAGGRAYKDGVVMYFYYTQHYIFSAELRIDEFQTGNSYPLLKYNPWIFPHPVYYTRAVNFRKFKYLRDLE